MKKKIIFFGIGNLTDVVFYYFKKLHYAEVAAFTVDENFMSTDSHLELPLINFKEIEKYFPPNAYELLIPLSPNKMNKLRENKFTEAKLKGYTLANFIHPSVLYESVDIGENNIIFENVILQPFSKIGNNNVIWSSSYIGHHVVIGDNNWVSAGTVIGGESIIKNNCFIGINTALKNNLILENETFIGMGLNINRNTKLKEVFTGESLTAHKITSDRLGKII
jgi:sugar O-acyltransferase (sialic acid O-acetyltransferase NeuD family)